MTKFTDKKVVFLFAAVSTLALTACSNAQEDIREEIEELTTKAVSDAGAESAAGDTGPDELKPKSDWLSQYYAEQKMKPLWTGRKNEKRLREYIAVLEQADRYGLNPEDYGLSVLKSSLDTDGDDNLGKLDLLISYSFVNFASDIRDGRLTPKIDFTEDDLAGRIVKKGEILSSFSKRKDVEKFVKSLRTDNPVQRSLLSALERYRAYENEEAWTTLTVSADKLEVDSTGEEVAAIAERLRAEGFFDGDVAVKTIENTDAEGNVTSDTIPLYNDRLAAAVEDFQLSRGIEPDGIVGPNTLARMNETPTDLVASIRMNIERARWLPQEFGDRHILVNIARYTAGFYDNEKLDREIRAVVGKYHEQTPVFAGSMSYAVVNPYWNIPESIVRGEIAPQMAKDEGYLASKNMEVVSDWSDDPDIVNPQTINWDDLPDPLGFRIRQKPGPTNALGHVKFMFPNDYAVYLHDSPAESLFNETKRAFSHGCIRLQDPVSAAEWIFESASDFDATKMQELIGTKEPETVVSLDEEIPVYITYFTTWADAATGEVYFLDDVYQRDPALKRALESHRATYASMAPKALK